METIHRRLCTNMTGGYHSVAFISRHEALSLWTSGTREINISWLNTSTDITSLPSFFWDKIGEQKHDIFCRFLTFCKFAPGNLVEWAFDVVENKQSITSQFHQKWPVQASQQIPAKA